MSTDEGIDKRFQVLQEKYDACQDDMTDAELTEMQELAESNVQKHAGDPRGLYYAPYVEYAKKTLESRETERKKQEEIAERERKGKKRHEYHDLDTIEEESRAGN